MQTYIHRYIHTYIHTYIHMHTRIFYMYRSIHIYIYIFINNIYVYVYVCVCVCVCVCACVCVFVCVCVRVPRSPCFLRFLVCWSCCLGFWVLHFAHRAAVAFVNFLQRECYFQWVSSGFSIVRWVPRSACFLHVITCWSCCCGFCFSYSADRAAVAYASYVLLIVLLWFLSLFFNVSAIFNCSTQGEVMEDRDYVAPALFHVGQH